MHKPCLVGIDVSAHTLEVALAGQDPVATQEMKPGRGDPEFPVPQAVSPVRAGEGWRQPTLVF